MIDQLKQEELLEAIELFYFSYRSFTAGPDQILQNQGLGRVHHRILYFVARNPHISINELLKILQVSKQALNQPLRKLIELELVSYQQSDNDRRIKQLFLSKKGRSLEGKLTNTQLQHLETAFSGGKNSSLKNWKEVMLRISLTGPTNKK
ncbi:MAG TPA: MarR family transcriptional regulator [Gammaproteobacteria bacterium]|nr:MarR family transcriptional regulator [Gammaproteobacteria bacterium]|tara:strand:+ start:153 stop:602 length:450 start_codon:yes stop_codon:yes gene_type:complete